MKNFTVSLSILLSIVAATSAHAGENKENLAQEDYYSKFQRKDASSRRNFYTAAGGTIVGTWSGIMTMGPGNMEVEAIEENIKQELTKAKIELQANERALKDAKHLSGEQIEQMKAKIAEYQKQLNPAAIEARLEKELALPKARHAVKLEAHKAELKTMTGRITRFVNLAALVATSSALLDIGAKIALDDEFEGSWAIDDLNRKVGDAVKAKFISKPEATRNLADEQLAPAATTK